MTAPVASGWQLEFVRLIAFSASSVGIDHRWWQELTSERPSESTQTFDRGLFSGTLLSCVVERQHIVWEARSRNAVSPATGGRFPTLGPLKEKLPWFVELMSPWLASSCPPILRLALSAKLLQLAASQTEAYRVLARHLPAASRSWTRNQTIFSCRLTSGDVQRSCPIWRSTRCAPGPR